MSRFDMNKYKKIQLEMEHKSTPTYQEEIERQPRLGGSRNVLANKTKHLFLLTMKKTHCDDNFAHLRDGREAEQPTTALPPRRWRRKRRTHRCRSLGLGGYDEHTAGRSLISGELRSALHQTRSPATQWSGAIGEMEYHLLTHRAVEGSGRPPPPPTGKFQIMRVPVHWGIGFGFERVRTTGAN
jgi:hypothetical protein